MQQHYGLWTRYGRAAYVACRYDGMNQMYRLEEDKRVGLEGSQCRSFQKEVLAAELGGLGIDFYVSMEVPSWKMDWLLDAVRRHLSQCCRDEYFLL